MALDRRTIGRARARARRFAFARNVLMRAGERLHERQTAGLPLLIMAGVALLWIGLWPESYRSIWHTRVVIQAGFLSVDESLQHFINDALAPYVVLSVIFLVAVYESGVHTTIAGVVLGLGAPASGYVSRDRFFDHAGRRLDRSRALRGEESRAAEQEAVIGELAETARGTAAPLYVLAGFVYPVVNYLVLPLFALANAGVELSVGQLQQAVHGPLFWGVAGGLVLGKPLGIVSGALMTSRGRAPDQDEGSPDTGPA